MMFINHLLTLQATEIVQEVESKGLIQPLIVVMTGGKSAFIMVDSNLICRVTLKDVMPIYMAVFYVFNISTHRNVNYILCLRTYIFS